MLDQIKLRAFELAEAAEVLVYRGDCSICERKVVWFDFSNEAGIYFNLQSST